MKMAITIVIEGLEYSGDGINTKVDKFNFATECECTPDEMMAQIGAIMEVVKAETKVNFETRYRKICPKCEIRHPLEFNHCITCNTKLNLI